MGRVGESPRPLSVQPIFDATELIAAHSDACSPRCSCTIRTALANFLPVRMLSPSSSSQEIEPPAIPAWFNRPVPTEAMVGLSLVTQRLLFLVNRSPTGKFLEQPPQRLEVAVDAAHLNRVSGLGGPNQLQRRLGEKTANNTVPGVRPGEQRIGRSPIAAIINREVARSTSSQTFQLTLEVQVPAQRHLHGLDEREVGRKNERVQPLNSRRNGETAPPVMVTCPLETPLRITPIRDRLPDRPHAAACPGS
jgi:hypothetical protein